MKTIRLFALLTVVVLSSCANKALATGAAASAPVTDECMQNVSLFTTNCKQNNYMDAVAPWEMVYKTCPTAHKNIYVLGVRIVDWQISQAKDANVKAELFDKMMMLFDQRIDLYAQNSPVERAKVLALKGQYYLRYKSDAKAAAYPWFKEAMNTLGVKSDLNTLRYYVMISAEMYKADTTLAETFISDYTLANTSIETILSNPSAKNRDKYVELKTSLDALFAMSGVADCAKLNEIYKGSVEANKTNNEYLQRTMRFFDRLDCTDQEAYFLAATYSHSIEPNAESAIGLGNMNFVKGEMDKAVEYYLNAVELYESSEDKADAYYRIAQCYYKLDSYSQVRKYCKLSLEMNPNDGDTYIMLGVIYASAGTVSEDPILNKAKYWAAVDQFIKAKNVDPTPEMIDKVNKLISTYSQYYPKKEEVFMHPDLGEGKSYFVGGIVSESTVVRSRK